MYAKDVKSDLQKLSDPEKAKGLQRFFKTGAGQYGESDMLLGSSIHEERLVALLILVQKYNSTSDKARISRFYVDNLKGVNNWDLVDLSAPSILGSSLMENDKSILYRMARSSNVWERRIAIVSTLQFIRNGEFGDTLKIAEILLHDDHDLIHKAAGWMLREVGKRDVCAEEMFLEKYCSSMPRTMLRYAVERFPEKKRKNYLRKN